MSRYVVMIDWSAAPHLSEEAKAEMAEAYPVHERDARIKGIPSLGAGAIYPVAEEEIVIDPIEFPAWYKRAYALDVGWNRTAALWGALDPETDVLYLYSEHYRGQAEPAIHADAIRSRGAWIPGVIDPASRGRSQHDGQQLFAQYTNPEHGRLNLALADNGVESGIYTVWSRLSTGRLKVFKTLTNFLMEYRIYRRDEKGRPVKENDHLVDCCRYLCASGLLRALPLPPEQWSNHIPGAAVKSQHRIEYSVMDQMYSNIDGGYM